MDLKIKKQKLTSELIDNAFDFYNKNLEEVFLENEIKNLSQKLLTIVEYDYMNTNEKLQYPLPQNTLYLIYFIGEYKKAYNHSKRTDKPKNNLESLGKGNYNKKKEFEKGLNHIFDETLDISIRYEHFFKNLLLLLLKKPSYKKVSLFMLGIISTQYPFMKPYLLEAFKDEKEILLSLNTLDYTLDFFEYSHLSDGKISNSALIMIYTVLTQNLNIDGDIAFKNAKYLTDTFIDTKNDYPTDSYRQVHITKRDIYYAGVYNGMPIFQWYIHENQKYFKQKDKEKLKVILKLFLKGIKEDEATGQDINQELTPTENMFIQILANLTNEKGIDILISSTHTEFAKLPFPLLKYLPQPEIEIPT